LSAILGVKPATGDEGVRLKSVALPVEHGGWGMLVEPLLLGLLVAPSWAGLGVGLAALGAFLMRHPLKLALADRLRGIRTSRTKAAERFVLLYALLAAAGLAVAATGRSGWWVPLAAAVPFGLVQLAYDLGRKGRQLLPELLGGVALGSVAAAELRAAGWPLGASLAAWLLLAARTVSAVLYVRARLRGDRGVAPNRAAALLSHAAALALGLALAAAGLAPWLVVLGFTLLLARAAHGLSPLHRPTRPRVLGFQEMAHGFGFVLILAMGYARGL
jgi:hypothetical protein